jgi:hypothetical protein
MGAKVTTLETMEVKVTTLVAETATRSNSLMPAME